MQSLLQLIHRHKFGEAVGIYSVCSAHSWVLESALQLAKERKTVLLIEATSNQVNQFGGYTGMQPIDFRNKVFNIAHKLDFPTQQIWLGGDHLGPNVWQEYSAEQAMIFSETLIYDYVKAGFRKIHLDCSMPCADDATPLTDEIVAQRAARLCAVAERSWQENGGEAPVYVIGTEVPTPGGAKSALTAIQITSAKAADTTLNIHQKAWHNTGLTDVWPRVIALVVQPGVEFDHYQVEHYQPEKAKALSQYIESHPHIVYEAHSTDYQTAQAYQNLVRDHFVILKVGPALTFALREALFALDKLDREWNGEHFAAHLSETLEQVMYEQPNHWRPYYQGSAHQQYIDRQYSLSDRIRYYWANPKVAAAVEKLLTNLRQHTVPLAMLSQYLPEQMEAINAGRLSATEPKEWVKDKIRSVLMHYAIACETKTEGAVVL
ncbi:D-tagatose-bisphosphate aldolase, class II, non-catalytic subunit [Arsenophonus sp. PmNCSU2021_1]|uniref:D-tagatose-bisphosphate aldolase, class II, non-catalytic subunit n=1 Tax=Arsenophonus sp. PmNCSU2021_1 TaxID=3118989 RepID=UPI002FF2B1F2